MICKPHLSLPIALGLIVGLLTPGVALAQVRNLDIETFRPVASRDGFLGIAGTRGPGPGALDMGLWFNYSARPLTIRRVADDRDQAVIDHRLGMTLQSQIGIGGRGALLLELPMVLHQEADGSVLGTGPAISRIGAGDARWAGRFRVLGEAGAADHERHEGEGLAIEIAGTIPIGDENAFAGEGAPQLEASVLGDFHFVDLGIGAVLGYRHRFAEPRVLNARFGNELFFGGAVQIPSMVIENLAVLAEVRVSTGLDGGAFAGSTTRAEGDLGFRWAENDFSVTWIVGTGFSSGVGTPAVRGVFGLSYSPRSRDLDADGYTDEADSCPRLAEDRDGFEDEDGCPDPDNDGDLIPDEEDHCPDVPADFGNDEDEDGCPDDA